MRDAFERCGSLDPNRVKADLLSGRNEERTRTGARPTAYHGLPQGIVGSARSGAECMMDSLRLMMSLIVMTVKPHPS